VPPKGCHIDLEVSVPILIGTIPIGSTFSNLKDRNFKGEKSQILEHELFRGPSKSNGTEEVIHPIFGPFPPLKFPHHPSEGGALEMKALLSRNKDQNKDENLYPDLSPPNYQEAKDIEAVEDGPKRTMRMDTDNEHATGNWDFKPIYPYYGKEEAS
jgi:hypothetical protein